MHVEHGIGRYIGLLTIDLAGAAHDVLHIEYSGGDKLYVPVENIEVLSRFGEAEGVALDKLGGAAWQARKARVKERITRIARDLMRIAAERKLRKAEVLDVPESVLDEFSQTFPYSETDDQLNAIDDVVEDLASGRPMDRLVCGDVGFGKTEVAIRAAFVAAMAGQQVAIVAPTTLLARQHFMTFQERFKGLSLKLAQVSRLVPAKALAATKEALSKGEVDIVIGTHALLAESLEFANLGPAGHRRGTALWRAPERAAEKAPPDRARADPDSDPHSPDAAAGADRGEGPLADCHRAGRPARGPHLHHAVGRRYSARSPDAGAVPRRSVLRRLPPGARSRRTCASGSSASPLSSKSRPRTGR